MPKNSRVLAKNYKAELKKITAVLLKPKDDYIELTKAIDDLYQLFSQASGLDADESNNREAVYLPSGKAIGPAWAAMCVKEILRTKRFVRGAYLGIKAALERFPCRPVHVLYAGTGPFATLAMPLTTVFSSSEVSFTMLEINPQSIESAGRVIKAFHAENYVREIIKCDAAEYDAGAIRPIHAIISETMQNALQKEPQVGITLNLLPHMEPEGIMIPQSIRIDAALVNYRKYNERMLSPEIPEENYYHIIGTIFELDRDIAASRNMDDTDADGNYTFKAREIIAPEDIQKEYRHLCLFTTIRVFGEEVLTNWQCSLTIPKTIMSFQDETIGVHKLRFRYVLSNTPGFECTVL